MSARLLVCNGHRVAIAAAILWTLSGSSAVAAEKDYSVESLPFNKCEFREVIARLQSASIDKAADIAKQTMPVLDKQRAINSKATNPTKPLGEQLKPVDVEAFGALGQRLQTLTSISLIEDRRQRDLHVMLDWGQQIDNLIRWGRTPSEGTQEYKEWGAFMAARVALDSKLPISTPNQPRCSLELAIHHIENAYITELNKLDQPIKEALATFKQLQAKYGGGKLDREKLSAADREVYDSIHINITDPASKFSENIEHYELLKILAAASELIYHSDLADLTQSGGDPERIGTTIANAASNNKLSEQQTIGVGVWRILDQQLPGEMAKAYQEMKRRLDAVRGTGTK